MKYPATIADLDTPFAVVDLSLARRNAERLSRHLDRLGARNAHTLIRLNRSPLQN